MHGHMNVQFLWYKIGLRGRRHIWYKIGLRGRRHLCPHRQSLKIQPCLSLNIYMVLGFICGWVKSSIYPCKFEFFGVRHIFFSTNFINLNSILSKLRWENPRWARVYRLKYRNYYLKFQSHLNFAFNWKKKKCRRALATIPSSQKATELQAICDLREGFLSWNFYGSRKWLHSQLFSSSFGNVYFFRMPVYMCRCYFYHFFHTLRTK